MQVSSLRIILMLDNIKWEDKIHLHQTAILLLSQNKIPNLFHTNNLIYIAPWYWHMPFLRHFTMNIITTAAQAKHYVIPLWGGATSSHLNSLGRIQAMRLPLGTGEPIWKAHYSSTHHHCQVPFLHLGEVRHTWSSHLAQGCYMVSQLAALRFKPCNLQIQSPMHYPFGHHVSICIWPPYFCLWFRNIHYVNTIGHCITLKTAHQYICLMDSDLKPAGPPPTYGSEMYIM